MKTYKDNGRKSDIFVAVRNKAEKKNIPKSASDRAAAILVRKSAV